MYSFFKENLELLLSNIIETIIRPSAEEIVEFRESPEDYLTDCLMLYQQDEHFGVKKLGLILL